MTLVKLIDVLVQAVSVMISDDREHRLLRIGLWMLLFGGLLTGLLAVAWLLVELPTLIG